MKIVIYSSLLCPYCVAAKALLKKLKLEYNEILIDNKPTVKEQMIKLSKRKLFLKFFLGKDMSEVMMIFKSYIEITT